MAVKPASTAPNLKHPLPRPLSSVVFLCPRFPFCWIRWLRCAFPSQDLLQTTFLLLFMFNIYLDPSLCHTIKHEHNAWNTIQ